MGTVIGGYLLLQAVVVAYYYGVARVGPGFLESAVTGTALLLGLAAPVFAAASWLDERRRRGRSASAPPITTNHSVGPNSLSALGAADRLRRAVDQSDHFRNIATCRCATRPYTIKCSSQMFPTFGL